MSGSGSVLEITGEAAAVDTADLSACAARVHAAASQLGAAASAFDALCAAVARLAARVQMLANAEPLRLDAVAVVRRHRSDAVVAELHALAAEFGDLATQARLDARRAEGLGSKLTAARALAEEAEYRVSAFFLGVASPVALAFTPLLTLGRSLAVTLGYLPVGALGSGEAARTLTRISSLLPGEVVAQLGGLGAGEVGGLSAPQRLARATVWALDVLGGRGPHVVVVGRADGRSCAAVTYPRAGTSGGSGSPAVRTCPVVTRRLGGPNVVTPLTGARLVDALDEPADGAHVVRILRHDTGGVRSWTVVVPGTEDWGIGGSSPFDMDTNLRVSGALPSAQEVAVAEAMAQMRIGAGEPVELVGHSQGAMVVARLVSDPLFTSRFRVTSALCVGGATAGARPRGGARMLAVDNIDDLVPDLDGETRPRRAPGLVSVRGRLAGAEAARLAPGVLPGMAQQHSRRIYARLVARAEASGDPAVAEWSNNRRHSLGLAKTTRTRAVDFAVERLR